jgi:DNA ligase-1
MADEKPFRPQLAAETPGDLEELTRLGHFPLFGSYKIDGIRGTIIGGKMLSRSGKLIPSAYAQEIARAHPQLEGVDGELVAASVGAGLTLMQASYSACMTHGSQEPLKWLVFDRVMDGPYSSRLADIHLRTMKTPKHIEVLGQYILGNVEQILTMEQESLDQGHEGLIVRRPDAPYKQGRSTLKQGYLVKVARRLTSEAWVMGFEELMHNDNPEKLNEIGYTKRSSHQANLRPSGMLGAFLVADAKTGVEFRVGIGEGLDHALRRHIWENQSEFLGKLMKYDYKPYGTAEKPRQPRWLGWRSPLDL